jgi:enoyl-[acyl-carrier protein] reductase II
MGLLENSIRDLEVTRREFTAIRAATNAPFGVNLPIRYLQMDPKEETATGRRRRSMPGSTG